MRLCSEKNSYKGMLIENSNKDPFGMGKLNRLFSDALFPNTSTLMPNLVYFYLIKPIYDAYMEFYNKETKELDREAINIIEEILESITKTELFQKTSKGFHGEIKASEFTDYRSALEKLCFLDAQENNYIYKFLNFQKDDWNEKVKEKLPIINGDKNYNYENLNANLKKTDRYYEVYKYAKKYLEYLSNPSKGEPPTPGFDKELTRLTNEEKQDFIIRVLFLNSSWKTSQSGVLEHQKSIDMLCFIMWYMMFKKEDKRRTVENLSFENLKDLFDNKDKNDTIEYFKQAFNDENYRKMKIRYMLARQCSMLEHIINIGYNVLLLHPGHAGEPVDENSSYYKTFCKSVNEYKKNECKNKNEDYITQYNIGVLLNKTNEKSEKDEIIQSLKYLHDIHNKIQNIDEQDKNAYIDLLNEIKKREMAYMGENSLLNSDIREHKEVNMFPDTFRWEYRHDWNDYLNKYCVDEVDRMIRGERTIDIRPMSVAYFVYELFEENGKDG